MTTYIALLRGINVGGHNILPMKELSTVLAEMGCQNVLTYIQSGNVVFQAEINDTKIFAEMISANILKSHGFGPKVWLMNQLELETAVNNNPFDTGNGKILHFCFLDDLPNVPNIKKLNELKTESESFELQARILYLFTPEGIGRSKLAAGLENCLGVPVTVRNWNTVQKLLSMIPS